MRNRVLYMILFIVTMISLAAVPAHADLALSYQFNGFGNWSLDAVGSNNTPVGTLDVFVPAGSTVEKAFLYSSLYSLSGHVATPTVQLGGVSYGPSDFVALGDYQPQPVSNPNFYLGAFRADVTTQVQLVVGSGGGTFPFIVNSENPNSNIDGEVLAVAYSNPAELQRTIFFFDGFSASAGDSFTVNFSEPLDTTIPGFEALYSLGIGFGAGGAQFSLVDIGGRPLTSSAGGADDGGLFNGGLITVGGLGDNAANPTDPTSSATADDELYNLALGNSSNPTPFLGNGITSFTVNTRNPSLDDNIFFAGLNVTAEAFVPNGEIPEPISLLLLGSGLVSLAGYARKRMKK